MKILRALVLIISGVIISITMSVMVMINGWGLQPKSWLWILCFGFLGQVVAHIFIKLGSINEDE